eukprot:COSAG01_NODE_66638_length_269_cov_0.917647_2_plen_48_part_01
MEVNAFAQWRDNLLRHAGARGLDAHTLGEQVRTVKCGGLAVQMAAGNS